MKLNKIIALVATAMLATACTGGGSTDQGVTDAGSTSAPGATPMEDVDATSGTTGSGMNSGSESRQ